LKVYFPILILSIIFLGCSNSSTDALYKKAKRKNNQEEAIKIYNQIIELDSNHTDSYNQLGLTYLYKNPDSSMRYFFKSISIDSNQAEPFFFIGHQYLRKSGAMNLSSEGPNVISSTDLDTAISYMTKAISIDSTSSGYYYDRAYCYYYHSNFNLMKDEHRSDLEKACSLGNSTGCTILETLDKGNDDK
jgi:tetratricopeptide (TPR) repeat protein